MSDKKKHSAKEIASVVDKAFALANAQKREKLIDKAVDNFLAWQLPQNFYPDGGIHFDGAGKTPEQYVDAAGYKRHWPIGTNLLTAEQAKAMIKHILEADHE